ncbi:DUF3887 domain-containing protein [Ornithinibacillus sp. L9]|uniref:DUF3887 domain-containing protein n=1 Tax=Ornithinibacillus caprae TaxID=2678566 RepID=A0A6N8FL49_9BACI|nr:DUF3887 domain-containing protein [Ornithinibacillus caprae]MUK90370.1 DUF3887 domain-containing protein [Ornithinibacillus caprae]
MKKILLPIFIVALMLMLVACSGEENSDSTTEKYIEQAEKVISLLNENNYEEVYAKFNDEMKQSLTLENMNTFTPLLEESGDFVEIDQSSVEEKDGYFVTVVVAKYTNQNRVFTISFSDNEEIAGLFVK